MPFCPQCGIEIDEEINFCPECGAKMGQTDSEVTEPTKICPICGAHMPQDMFYCLNCGIPFGEATTEDFDAICSRVKMQFGVWKNKWIALFLCLFLGWLGAHRFYEKKILTGILYFCTLGLFGIGIFIDLVRIAFKPNPYRVK